MRRRVSGGPIQLCRGLSHLYWEPESDGRTRATPQLFDTYCRSYVTLMSLAHAPLYVASAWYGGIMLLRVRWGVILNTVGSSMTGALVTQLTDGRGGWLTFDTCYSEIESLTLS